MRSRQRSQATVEFALSAVALLVLLFGAVDAGRAAVTYLSLQLAADEGLRVATAGLPPDYTPPGNAGVLSAIRTRSAALGVRMAACQNGPISSPSSGSVADIYITDPSGSSPAGAMNAPGGQPDYVTWGGGCAAIVPAGAHAALRVTATTRFTFVTPLVEGAIRTPLNMTAYAIGRTEY